MWYLYNLNTHYQITILFLEIINILVTLIWYFFIVVYICIIKGGGDVPLFKTNAGTWLKRELLHWYLAWKLKSCEESAAEPPSSAFSLDWTFGIIWDQLFSFQKNYPHICTYHFRLNSKILRVKYKNKEFFYTEKISCSQMI